MISSTSFDGSRAMAEERAIRATNATRASRIAAALLLLAVLAVGTASTALAAPPDETCHPGQTFAAGGFDLCAPPKVSNGGGGFEIGALLPIVLALVVGAGLALAVAYFVLRRRAGGPLDPVDAGEWWTCTNCGRQNMVGSPRCYSCGTWQGGARPDKPASER
jgi:hypothetical protein